MAATEAVDGSLAKKRRTEEEEDKKPSMLSYVFFEPEPDNDSSSEEDDVPLTEESKREISDFRERFLKSGGFDVPKISPTLLDCVIAPIQRKDHVACRTKDKDKLINVVNTAIRVHEKNNKKKNEMMDLVLVEILSAALEFRGMWHDYITFKAKDSSGFVRTYETLITPMPSDEMVVLEVFRVKPYTPIEFLGHDKVERPRVLV